MGPFAQLRAYSTLPLNQTGVSEVFTYFGWSPPSVSRRAPNATGSPATSKIGKSTRAWKASRRARLPVRARPASVSSSGRKPLPRKCVTRASHDDARPLRQPPDRLGERQRLPLLEKVDRVAALGATEAVVVRTGGVDGEGGGLLLVEGAEGLHAGAAGGAQGHVLAD